MTTCTRQHQETGNVFPKKYNSNPPRNTCPHSQQRTPSNLCELFQDVKTGDRSTKRGAKLCSEGVKHKKNHDATGVTMVPQRKETPWTIVADEASCRPLRLLCSRENLEQSDKTARSWPSRFRRESLSITCVKKQEPKGKKRGESEFALSEYHGSLTRECQLHMCASLDRAQTNTTNMQRIFMNARPPIPSHRAMKTKKGKSVSERPTARILDSNRKHLEKGVLGGMAVCRWRLT